MWVRVRAYGGRSWRWKQIKTRDERLFYDETALNIPKRKTTQIVWEDGVPTLKNKNPRQYNKNPKTALCLISKDRQIGFYTVVPGKIQKIPSEVKARFLKKIKETIGHKVIHVDSRNVSLERYGFRVQYAPKKLMRPGIECLFGYKRMIHKLDPSTPQDFVEQEHMKYLQRIFKVYVPLD